MQRLHGCVLGDKGTLTNKLRSGVHLHHCWQPKGNVPLLHYLTRRQGDLDKQAPKWSPSAPLLAAKGQRTLVALFDPSANLGSSSGSSSGSNSTSELQPKPQPEPTTAKPKPKPKPKPGVKVRIVNTKVAHMVHTRQTLPQEHPWSLGFGSHFWTQVGFCLVHI